MLTEDADWDARTWDMDKSNLPRLAQAIHTFSEELGNEFTFRVAWIGETTLRKQPIVLPYLVNVIREGRIENRVEYVVHYG